MLKQLSQLERLDLVEGSLLQAEVGDEERDKEEPGQIRAFIVPITNIPGANADEQRFTALRRR